MITVSFQIFPYRLLLNCGPCTIGEVWRGPLRSLKLYVELWYMCVFSLGWGEESRRAHNVLKKKILRGTRSIQLFSLMKSPFVCINGHWYYFLYPLDGGVAWRFQTNRKKVLWLWRKSFKWRSQDKFFKVGKEFKKSQSSWFPFRTPQPRPHTGEEPVAHRLMERSDWKQVFGKI